MNTFQQCLDMQPSSPQGFPPWGTIAFAAQIAAIAGNGMPTLLDCHRRSFAVIQMRHHLHDVGWQHLEGGLLRILPRGGSHLHQAHGQRGQHPQEGAQGFIVLHLTLLDPAPGFESLMKVFDQKAGHDTILPAPARPQASGWGPN